MRCALALLSCALAVPAAAATLPLSRGFQDWSVDCDNGGRCVAIGLQDRGAPVLAARIEREAGPEGALRAVLLGPALGADGRLLLDGRAMRLDRGHWRWHPAVGDDARARWETADAAAVRAFVDAVRNGTLLVPAASRDEGGLSLRGLSAALLLVDDVQGRIGTRGALLRRGDRPDADVPPAPALPRLRRTTPPVRLAEGEAARLAAGVRDAQAALLAADGCDAGGGEGDAVHALTDREALVLLTCMTGAYQVGSLAFRAPRAAPQRARPLALPMLPGEAAPDMLWFAGYGRGVLRHHVKGRGLGDCGDSVHWLFDGADFRLLEVRRMGRCGGLLPDDWPTLWRATVAP